MTNETSPYTSTATSRSFARFLGALVALIFLVLAGLSAVAINELVNQQFVTAVVIVLGVVAVRWLGIASLERWGEVGARRLRHYWRARLSEHLGLPRREGERSRADLAVAIEDAAYSPTLERLKASAGASLVGLPVLFIAAGWLPFLITAALLTLSVPLYVRAGRRSERATRTHVERRAILESRQLEVLRHAPELRALGALEYGAGEITAISNSEHELSLRAIRVALGSSLVTEFLSGVSIGLVAMVVGFSLLDGRISLLRALIALFVCAELFSNVRRYGSEFHRFENAGRAESVLAALHVRQSTSSELSLLKADELVTMCHDVPVALELFGGERIWVCGPSGSGKTTLLTTLLGWTRARSGTVALTSGPVGYVSAESALVSGTLRENVTLDEVRDDQLVLQVLYSLGLSNERFGDLDLPLLSEGRDMSSGERVRLALARALLCEPALLVLDDIAGVLDEVARSRLRAVLEARPNLAVIEASVDSPLLNYSRRIDLGE